MLSYGTGEASTRRCVWFESNGKVISSPSKSLITDEVDHDVKGYPIDAETVFRYLTKLKEFQGEVRTIPPESLTYYFHSTEMNKPGAAILSQQVEVDLSRFYSIRINGAVLYDKRRDEKVTMTASDVFNQLYSAFSDRPTAINCSQLLTQATFAGPAKDFLKKYAHVNLMYSITNQFTTDIIVNTVDRDKKPLQNIPLYFHMILAIRDLSKIDQASSSDDLFVQGYCVISRKISIPRESLCSRMTKGASIEDRYSKFFETSKEAFDHLDGLIAEENAAPLPESLPGGNCIIA